MSKVDRDSLLFGNISKNVRNATIFFDLLTLFKGEGTLSNKNVSIFVA